MGTKNQAKNRIKLLLSQTSKMMKLTLVCMVAAMVMGAQAINVKEDADGLIHLELRHNDVADNYAALDYMLEVGARRIACPWKACCCAKASEALKAACGVSGGLLC